MAIVTGRPREEALEFLERFSLQSLFSVIVAMEDTPKPKPDPAPVRLAVEKLQKICDPTLTVEECVMVGDTVDDALSARAAGVSAHMVLTPVGFARQTLKLEDVEEKLRATTLSALSEQSSSPSPAGGQPQQHVGTRESEELTDTTKFGVFPPGLAHLLGRVTQFATTKNLKAAAITSSSTSFGVPASRPGFGVISRSTKETSIECRVWIPGRGGSVLTGTGDAPGPSSQRQLLFPDNDDDNLPLIRTGVRFLDHMVEQLSKHGKFGILLRCNGDVDIDDHHTVEDCGIALGEAFDRALGARVGFKRFGSAYAPLDEALARAVVDVSSRPHAAVDLKLTRERIGDCSCEMLVHFIQSFVENFRATIHVEVLRGVNNHHMAECSFKALALALSKALASTSAEDVPSTKAMLA